MSRLIKTVALSCLVGILSQTVVQAASEDEGKQMGKPYRLSVRGDVEYTDNRDSSENNEESNTDLYLRPRLDLYYQSTASEFDLFYVPSFRYRSNPAGTQNENELLHLLDADWRYDLSERTRTRLMNRFEYTDDPAVENGAVVRQNASYFVNRIDGIWNYDLLEYSNLDFWAAYRAQRYDRSELAQVADQDQALAALSLRHQLTETLRSVATLRYNAFAYDSIELDRDYQTTAIIGGVEKSFSESLLGGATFGALVRNYSDATITGDGDILPYAKFLLHGNTIPTTDLDFVLEAGMREADVVPYASQEFVEVSGKAFWRAFNDKTRLGIVFLYRVSMYDDDQLPGDPADYGFLKTTEGDERTFVGVFDIAYSALENTTLRFSQRYENIDSDLIRSYTKNTSMVSVDYSF